MPNGQAGFYRPLSAALVVAWFFAFVACSRGDPHPDLAFSVEDSQAGKRIETGSAITVGTEGVAIVGEDGGELGVLLPGAPLTSLASDEARVRVELKGWAPVNYRVAVTSALGERLTFAKLGESGQAAREVLSTAEDLYGEAWEEVRLTGWVAKDGIADNAATVWTAAEKIYQELCSACHVAPAPEAFTVNQWPGNLDAMADDAGLMDEELILVRQYLQTHARNPLQTPAAETPDDEEEQIEEQD